LGLLVHQPKAVKTGALTQWVRERQPDFALVMAYGRILPLDVLLAPRMGSLNLHASLLPAYRGAAPINWALMNGDTQTGISLMQMDAGMDTGPVFTRRALAIAPDENAGELAVRLSALAAEVTQQDVPQVVTGRLQATPQDASMATYAPPLDRALSQIHWQDAAEKIVNLVRGMAPRPAAHTRVRGKGLKVLKAHSGPALALAPGQVQLEQPLIRVATGQGSVYIEIAQLEGKRAADARDLINGRLLRNGDCLGS
jgi:methionyl-tRNA formyltransferase